MQKKQQWSPDTCKCKIEQTYDYSTNPATLVNQEIITACPHHSLANDALTENRNKNIGVSKIAEMLQVEASDVKWELDENRKIAFILPTDITDQQKSDIKIELARMNDKFIV